MMVLSISNLLTVLVGRVPSPQINEVPAAVDADQRRIATTVRLEPNVKAFVERYAEGLGLSVQDFVGMTLRAVMTATENPKVSELDLLVSRFFDLFQSYRIDTVDIPLLLPDVGLRRADLEHRDRVLNALDRSAVTHLANTFMVNPDWLAGVRSECVDRSQIGRWYKSPATFARALLKFKHQPSVQRISVMFVTDEHSNLTRLNEAREKEDGVRAVNVTPVIVLNVKVSGINFDVFDIWDTQRWNYINCRLGLKAMMMLCERARITMDGIALPEQRYGDFLSTKTLPPNVLSRPYHSWPIDDVVWDSESNLERAELDRVKDYYARYTLDSFEKALSGHKVPINLERVLEAGELPKFSEDGVES